MINILLSDYGFGEGILLKKLSKYIKPNMKITVIPFSFSETEIPSIDEYNRNSTKGGKYFELLYEQFKSFGIKYENINAIHYYDDSTSKMKKEIQEADIIFFTGGLPDKMMERLEEKKLIQTIQQYDGIVMGASAGALIQISDYFCTPDNDYDKFCLFKGLGVINKGIDFYIEVHYTGEDIIKEYSELNNIKKRIYCIPDNAGIVCDGIEIETIGNIVVL